MIKKILKKFRVFMEITPFVRNYILEPPCCEYKHCKECESLPEFKNSLKDHDFIFVL